MYSRKFQLFAYDIIVISQYIVLCFGRQQVDAAFVPLVRLINQISELWQQHVNIEHNGINNIVALWIRRGKKSNLCVM